MKFPHAQPRKSRLAIKIALVLIILSAVGLWFVWPQGGKHQYRTDTITRGSISQVVTANGTVNPVTVATVGTQVSGAVEKIYVGVTDEVKKGQLLAEVDPKLAESALKQSRSALQIASLNLAQAQRDSERNKQLLSQDYIARVEYERSQLAVSSAQNSYEAAKAQLERDETNLSYTKITSPIDGVIISVDVTAGQTVAASFQTPNLFKIAASLKDMKIDVNLPEADIGKVKKGLPVKFSVDAYPDKEFTGIVDVVNLNPNTTQTVVTYNVTVLLSNDEKLLLPGMTAYVSITLMEKPDVLRVPAVALRYTPSKPQENALVKFLSTGGTQRPGRGFGGNAASGDGKQTIHLLKDGKPESVSVTTGATDDNYVEVSGENIKEGDTVILSERPNVDK